MIRGLLFLVLAFGALVGTLVAAVGATEADRATVRRDRRRWQLVAGVGVIVMACSIGWAAVLDA